jgi:hypothetical protein
MTPYAQMIEHTFNIVNKDGTKVPFKLNSVQRKFDKERTSRNVIVKARQEGFSSFICAENTMACLAEKNIRCVLIAHDSQSTEKLFDRVRFFLEHPQVPLKPILKRSNRREFYFKENNSAFYIGTAGSENFGRGDTINRLHCSEVGMWDNAQSLTAGLFEAVPRQGVIDLESTANGSGTWFHLRSMRAREGKSRFKMHFYSWADFDEYRIERDQWPSWWGGSKGQFTDEEKELLKIGLVPEQLAWRFEKMCEMDDSELASGSNMFPQEYPLTFEEAWLASGRSVFKNIPFAECDVSVVGDLEMYRAAEKGHTYVIGVDVGAGLGGDSSIITCLDCDTFEQVCEWSSNEVDPDELAFPIKDLAERYNGAYVVPELNNHGIATVAQLRRIYSAGRILQRYSYDKRDAVERLGRLGWLTTEKTKSQLVTNLRRSLREGLKVYSVKARNELTTFVELKPGRFGAQSGCYDDRVIALALAVSGYRHMYKPHDEVIFDAPAENSFVRARSEFLREFKSQHGVLPSEIFGRQDTGFVC